MRDGDTSQPVTQDISTLAVDEMTDVDARLPPPHPKSTHIWYFLNFFKAVFAMAEFSQEDELVKRTGLGKKTTENSPLCFGLCQALSLRLGSFDTPFSIIPRLHLFNPPHPPASPQEVP